MSLRRVPGVVRIGGLEKPALRGALETRAVLLNRAAEALFDHPRFEPGLVARVLEIRCLTVAELGFPHGATRDQLMVSANALGLRDCPLELAPHLRLAFVDQVEAPPHPVGAGTAPAGSVTVMSAPLDDSDRTPKGFYLLRQGGRLWLRGYRASADHVWKAEDTLVFCI